MINFTSSVIFHIFVVMSPYIADIKEVILLMLIFYLKLQHTYYVYLNFECKIYEN